MNVEGDNRLELDHPAGWVALEVAWSESFGRAQVVCFEAGLGEADQPGVRIKATLDGTNVYIAGIDRDQLVEIDPELGAAIQSSSAAAGLTLQKLPEGWTAKPRAAAQGLQDIASSDKPEKSRTRRRGARSAKRLQKNPDREEAENILYYLPGMRSALPQDSIELNAVVAIDDDDVRSAVDRALRYLVLGMAEALREALDKICHVGPLREIPPRNFEAPRSPDPGRWYSGMAAWDTLATGPLELVQNTSDWLKSWERLATGCGVVRRRMLQLDEDSELAERIKSYDPDLYDAPSALRALGELPTVVRLNLVSETQGTIKVEAHDVGVGIAQLLPVVVAALQTDRPLVMIEQPELHVHPRVQVGLGDLFAAQREEHTFIIETHSEHLLLRLLRRVREIGSSPSTDGSTPLEPKDLSILVFHRREDGSIDVQPMEVDEAGEFVGRWPGGFFDERAKELF